jgi:dipeptidyl aminopeptidase/acylaminoacyl peptidase
MNSDLLRPDIRETPLYQQAKQLLHAMRNIGAARLSDAAELDVSVDGRHAVFSGTVVDSPEGSPQTRIWHIELETGDHSALSSGPHSDRSAKFSPDGSRVAFLTDRLRPGDYQLGLLDLSNGKEFSAPRVPGWVEYLQWSTDGRQILLGVAGHGADVAGAQGAVASQADRGALPAWIPTVETADEAHRWRSAWLYDLESNRIRQINRLGLQVWEAVWCGANALAAVVSPGPDEGLWYSATLVRIDVETAAEQTLYAPKDQLGCVAASPSGAHLVVVEAVCSDRGLVAGDALLVSFGNGKVQRIDALDVDITSAQWRSDDRLLLTGHRAFASVVCRYDLGAQSVVELWSSDELTSGGRNRYLTVAGIGADGDCALVGEGFLRAPEIAVIRAGRYRAVRSLDQGYVDYIGRLARFEPVRWNAQDGMEIHGWLMRPQREAPHPLVMEIHGGPVWQWRPKWLAREGLHTLMLLEHGYAVFWPNPRGSTGRGQDFARRVQGDLCGADTFDLLSGLDELVMRKVADPRRLGVMGRSYGGCMTAWLITRDTRFAAAVALAPHTNQVSQHLTSNIPQFDTLFLADRYDNPAGRHFERSPVMYARAVRTPTLNVCGALDRCTPPGQALEFYNALREHGVPSALVTYPQEGHGNKMFPAVVDYAARVTAWFETYMPATAVHERE